MKIMKDKEIALVKEILKKLGASEEDSEFVAEATIDADLKGFTSHGLGRFPQYLISIEAGTINLKDDIEIEKETPAIALINGNSGFGQAVSYKAMQIAIKKAKEVGIGCVGVHNTNHFGVTGFYSDLALRENCIGLVLANTDPAIAPLGGSQALIGTNPIALGIPSETYITVDMATSVTARGKIIESKRKGMDLPDGWALDKDGNPIQDPNIKLLLDKSGFPILNTLGQPIILDKDKNPLDGGNNKNKVPNNNIKISYNNKYPEIKDKKDKTKNKKIRKKSKKGNLSTKNIKHRAKYNYGSTEYPKPNPSFQRKLNILPERSNRFNAKEYLSTCFACDLGCSVSRSGYSPMTYSPYGKKEKRRDLTPLNKLISE